MPSTLKITTVHKGEPLSIDFFAKEPDGAVIDSPESQVVYLTFARTDGDDPLLQFASDDGSAKITLADALTGLFKIRLEAPDIALLKEGRTYYLNIWTELSGPRRLQVDGTITLAASIEPT